jgi:integrase
MGAHSVIAWGACATTFGDTASAARFLVCLDPANSAYAAQLNNSSRRAEQRPMAAPGTFAALAIRYYGSPQFQSLSATSRSNYRRVIDGFLEQHGHRRVDQMTREHVDIVVGRMADTPGAGIILLKRIRTLIRYAMALGWTDRDPTAGVKAYRSKEIHTWNEQEIEVFEKRWPEDSRERLAFALLLYTGQRGSDVHRMSWTDKVEDTIRVAQRKTAARLSIPIHNALHRLLALANNHDQTILATAYGKPFSVKGLGNMMSRAIGEAGLPKHCKPHGLRKAAARRLAEAGCSASEIMAITGHKTLAEVERYTRAAEQERLARQAVGRAVWGSGAAVKQRIGGRRFAEGSRAAGGGKVPGPQEAQERLSRPGGSYPTEPTTICPAGWSVWSRAFSNSLRRPKRGSVG